MVVNVDVDSIGGCAKINVISCVCLVACTPAPPSTSNTPPPIPLQGLFFSPVHYRSREMLCHFTYITPFQHSCHVHDCIYIIRSAWSGP
jgi:hypothetical protein